MAHTHTCAKRLTGKQVLDIMFALPSDTENSDTEKDDGAYEELNELKYMTDTSEPTSASTSEPRSASASRGSGRRQSSAGVTTPVDTAPASASTSEPRSASASRGSARRQSSADTPRVQDETVSFSCDSDGTSDDSYSEDDTVVDGNDVWCSKTDQFDTLPEFDDEHACSDVLFDNRSAECDYFRSLFSADIMQNIVDQTNLYAQQERTKYVTRAGRRFQESAQTKNWSPLSLAELDAFIGMHILMAIHVLPQLKHYWSSDPLLGVPAVSKVMTAKRFKKITETIHVNDNEKILPKSDENYDKLHKLRPMIDQLNEAIGSAYKPSKCVSIDESMIAFKGRSTLKQYMPLKPVKRGYKVWCLADAENGFVMRFSIYTGKANQDARAPEVGLGESVVLRLISNINPSCQLVAFDNFFTTVNLMYELNKRGLYAIGTVRPSRRGIPCVIKQKEKLDRGEHRFQTNGQIAAIKWQDRKPVTVLSTGFNPSSVVKINRKNKDGTKSELSCPTAIAWYNKVMGGVDHFDQFRERYAIGRRSLKWWHRIFFYLIDLAIVDAFLLWSVDKRNGNTYDQLHFRVRLARQLIGDHSTRKRKGPPVAFLAHKKRVPDDVRLVGVGHHMPRVGPTFRRCRLCSSAAHEQRTRCLCTACNVPLCMEPCFRKFHSK